MSMYITKALHGVASAIGREYTYGEYEYLVIVPSRPVAQAYLNKVRSLSFSALRRDSGQGLWPKRASSDHAQVRWLFEWWWPMGCNYAGPKPQRAGSGGIPLAS